MFEELTPRDGANPPDDGDSASADEIEPLALDAWKNDLRRDVERWLATLDEVPEEAVPAGDEAESADVPDLMSFYEQLAAATTEARRANRRSAEAFSQWSEALGGLGEQLGALREQLGRTAVATDESLPRRWCLPLVELIDRLERLAAAFAAPPASPRRRWFGDDGAWRAAWNTQRQAFDILLSHAQSLIRSAGVVRVDTVGRPFDPQTMIAVATSTDPREQPGIVVEELAAGYLMNGELLRTAQVRVSSR